MRLQVHLKWGTAEMQTTMCCYRFVSGPPILWASVCCDSGIANVCTCYGNSIVGHLAICIQLIGTIECQMIAGYTFKCAEKWMHCGRERVCGAGSAEMFISSSLFIFIIKAHIVSWTKRDRAPRRGKCKRKRNSMLFLFSGLLRLGEFTSNEIAWMGF